MGTRGVRLEAATPSSAGMDDEREELRAVTRAWSDTARAAFLAAYARHREAGSPHEAALMLALGEMLP